MNIQKKHEIPKHHTKKNEILLSENRLEGRKKTYKPKNY